MYAFINVPLSEDKKRPGAARRSMYYLVNGKRTSSARGWCCTVWVIRCFRKYL